MTVAAAIVLLTAQLSYEASDRTVGFAIVSSHTGASKAALKAALPTLLDEADVLVPETFLSKDELKRRVGELQGITA